MEDFDRVDSNILSKQYLKMLSQSIIEIFLVGKYNSFIQEYIKTYLVSKEMVYIELKGANNRKGAD